MRPDLTTINLSAVSPSETMVAPGANISDVDASAKASSEYGSRFASATMSTCARKPAMLRVPEKRHTKKKKEKTSSTCRSGGELREFGTYGALGDMLVYERVIVKIKK